jgi:hypothetical protein
MRKADAALEAELRGILHGLLGARRVAILAPCFDRFFEPVLAQLAECGASVAGVLAWRSDPAFAAGASFPVLTLEGKCGAEGESLEPILTRLPGWVEAWINTIDPSRELLFLGNQFVGSETIAGRPVFGWRQAQWAALEDKTLVGGNAAVASLEAPDHVVAGRVDGRVADLPCLCAHLDRGHGVIVSADAGRLDRGGSSNNAYHRSPVEWGAVEAAIPPWAERVRISSFVPAIPCSINGVVLGAGRAMIFDAIEIVTLLDVERSGLLFCGSSTRLRLPSAMCDEARAAARRVAHDIAAGLDFRGGFSIDGLLADGRFLFTEINARPASGIGLRHAWPSFPFFLFARAVMAEPAAFAALPVDALETAIRGAIRSRPSHAIAIPTRTVARLNGLGPSGYAGGVVAALASRVTGRRFADGLATRVEQSAVELAP